MSYRKVKLQSIDKKIYEVPINILRKVKLISGLVEQASDEGKIILLREIEGKHLEQIIKYLRHYKNFEPKKIPKPFPERTDETFLRGILNDEWTFNYIQSISLEESISIINGAHYLRIKGLLRILAAKLSYEMSNCDVEEAREIFGIECDMTEEEIKRTDRLYIAKNIETNN